MLNCFRYTRSPLATTQDDASEEVLALQNKIAWLEHQLTIKKEEALESHRAAVMEKELDKTL